MSAGRDIDGARTDRRAWLLVLPVAAWGLHFLAVYIFAAVYCAKASAGAGLEAAKLAILAATITALAALGALAWRARRRYRGAGAAHDENRFIGATGLMLCALSTLAVLAVASVVLFFGDCRR
jgi:hypothetical protein